MARRTGWSLLAAAAAALMVAGACNDPQSPRPQALLGLPDVGALAVTVATSGSNTPSGYTVTVDGSSSQSVGANGVATFIGLAPGDHVVLLSGVPSNCTVSGANPRTVSLIAGLVAATTFSVSCTAPPPPPTTGELTVTTSTSGSNIDADGYTVTVDGGASQAIGVNGSVTFSGLSAGSHTVVLSGVAGNCSVSGGTSRTANVTAGATASTSFSVTCTAPPPQTGSLSVSASTTGSNLDPDGYTATVDGGASQSVATNGSVTFTGLSAGSHSVALSGVAANCSVSGSNPQTVSVPAGGTATASFTVSCAATGGGTGSVTVSTSTTGSNLDPDGYTVTIDGSFSQPIATNGSVTFTGPSGDHSLALSGVASNCTVGGANPRTVTVPAGGTTTTTFSVTCAATGGGGGNGEVIGQGQIGNGSPTPGSDATTFDFDVRGDLTGRFTATDYADMHGSTPASLTTDPVADPATSFTAYRNSSSACSDPTHGVEVDAVGREDTGTLVSYTLTVCDNGPAGSGSDFFQLFIPSQGFGLSGPVTSGDISKR